MDRLRDCGNGHIGSGWTGNDPGHREQYRADVPQPASQGEVAEEVRAPVGDVGNPFEFADPVSRERPLRPVSGVRLLPSPHPEEPLTVRLDDPGEVVEANVDAAANGGMDVDVAEVEPPYFLVAVHMLLPAGIRL